MDDRYSIKQVVDIAEFEKLRTAWNALADKQGDFMPFLCFEWFRIWLDHFLKDHNLLILLVYKENELSAIAPCIIKVEKFRGINVRKMELIGNVYSPFRYFLFDIFGQEERIKGVSSIFEFLLKDYRKWDIFDLSSIPEENNCFSVVKTAIKQDGMRHTESICYGDWYLDEIDFSGEQYFNQLPEKIRKDVSYCKRRLQKMGKYEFKLIRTGDEIDHYIDLYYEVYSKSWQEKEDIGPNFHRDLATMAIQKDWLRLGFLFFNDCPVASQFWIAGNGTAFILKTVYDQTFRKYSPGKVLTSEMAKFVIDNDKVKTIDYVQGDEAYKQDWTPHRRERRGIKVFNNTTKGRLIGFLMASLLPALRRNPHLLLVRNRILRHLRRRPKR